MKIEFVTWGSPNDAFWSQVAMFRRSLDALGDLYRSARLALVYSADEYIPMPARWRPHFRNIETNWATAESLRQDADCAQLDLVFTLLDHSADVSIICDADTILIRPLPVEFLREVIESPAICGTIAHLPMPMCVEEGKRMTLPPGATQEDLWRIVSQHVLGRPIALDAMYTIGRQPCPSFYINYGFVAGTPALLRALHGQLQVVAPLIREVIDNRFYDQIGVALGVARGNLATRTLPMRYNFPNDVRAETMYPDEAREAIVLHYLRTQHFDRHRIFASRHAFDHFLKQPLSGSNQLFREHIRKITDGAYPF